MKNNKIINFYNNFHSRGSLQNKIISKNNFTYRKIIKEILNIINKENLNILDYGCGVGTLSLFLSSLNNEIIGIDVSNEAIIKARKSLKLINKNYKAKFYNINEGNNKISKIKFDLIICIEVIEHVPEDLKLINFLGSKLKKNGYLIVTVPSSNSPLYRLGLLTNFDKKVGHLRRYNIEKLETLFSDNIFVVEKVVKTEGILRNSLFVFPLLNFVIRFLKWVFSDIVSYVDNLFVILFGESNIILIARKK